MSHRQCMNGAKMRRKAAKRERKLATWGDLPHAMRKGIQRRTMFYIDRRKHDNRERVVTGRFAGQFS